jgi:hypothetical protein
MSGAEGNGSGTAGMERLGPLRGTGRDPVLRRRRLVHPVPGPSARGGSWRCRGNAAGYFGADFTSASHFLRRRVRSAEEPYFAVS